MNLAHRSRGGRDREEEIQFDGRSELEEVGEGEGGGGGEGEGGEEEGGEEEGGRRTVGQDHVHHHFL